MPLTAFPVPTTTVVSAVDTFLTSANQAAMRTNIGLGSVDDTSDAAKPVSTPQQTALDLKQNLLLPPAAMGALVIDATSGTINTKSISVDSTFTQSVPVSGASWVLILQNTDTEEHIITLPVAYSFFSEGLGSIRTTFTIPASATVVIRFYYNGVTIFMGGDPLTQGDFIASGGLAPVILRSSLITLGGGTGDLGTITVPDWITNYRLAPTTSASITLHGMRSVSAAGTLAAAVVTLRNAAAGAGDALSGSVTMTDLTAADKYTGINAALTTASFNVQTGRTIYCNFTVDSANAGTAYVYVTLIPLL